MRMTPIIEKLFVDRDRELETFQRMITRESRKCIMTLRAPGGVGKSWLMARLQHECSCQEICMDEIDFRSSKVYDYLAILRHTREAYGAKHFNSFTALVNKYTQAQPRVQIGGGGAYAPPGIAVEDVTQSQVEVAARDVIRDNFFLLPPTPSIPLQEIRERVSTEFVGCLFGFLDACQEPVVWFFDHFEAASEEVVQWLRDEFLTRIRDLEFNNLIVVIAGRGVPKFGMEWNHVVCAYDLDRLKVDDFEEYVEKTKITMSRETVEWLYRAYDGDIQRFAMELHAYEQEMDQ